MGIVSVIVPVYNRDDTIERCLSMIRESKLDHELELIVVDNGSTDRSIEIAKRYADHVLFNRSRNIALARNKGAGKAQGELLVFIDSDIYVEEDTIGNLVRTLEENSMAMVGGAIYYYGGENHGKQQKPEPELRRITFNNRIYVEAIYGCIQATTRTVFNKVGGYDPFFSLHGEDFDLCIRYWGNGFPLIYEPTAVAWHEQNRKIACTQEHPGRQFNLLKAIYLLPYKYEIKTRSSNSLNYIRTAFAEISQEKLAKEVHDFLTWLITFQRFEEKVARKRYKCYLPYGYTEELFNDTERVIEIIQRGEQVV